MQVSWGGASIVVAAQNHNPSITSPDWLRRNGVVEDEEPVNFAHTPLFALYQSERVQVLIQPERLELTLRIVSVPNLERLAEGARRYVERQPHVPYHSVGLNFVWQGVPETPTELDHLAAVPEGSFEQRILGAGQLSKGLLIQQTLAEYRMRVMAEPPSAQGLKLDFNFHFMTRGADAVYTALAQATGCHRNSELVANRILRQEVNA